MTATIPSSLCPPPPRIRHLAHQVHALGPEVLAYLAVELVASSSGALDRLEAFTRLVPCADFIAANMSLPPTVRRIK